MHALLVVDIQNDFLPGGALAVFEGDHVIPVANRLMMRIPLVIATQDWHPADHGSFASQHPGFHVFDMVQLAGLEQVLWPDHCVQGSFGAEFCREFDTSSVDHVIHKGTERDIDSYSAFFDNAHRKSTGLADLLQQHGVTELSVLGLALDYCVKFTALDGLQLGFAVRVVLDGCRGVNRDPDDSARTCRELQAAGAQLVDSDDVVGNS